MKYMRQRYFAVSRFWLPHTISVELKVAKGLLLASPATFAVKEIKATHRLLFLADDDKTTRKVRLLIVSSTSVKVHVQHFLRLSSL